MRVVSVFDDARTVLVDGSAVVVKQCRVVMTFRQRVEIPIHIKTKSERKIVVKLVVRTGIKQMWSRATHQGVAVVTQIS